MIHNAIPQGLKPNISSLPSRGTAEVVLFQNSDVFRGSLVDGLGTCEHNFGATPGATLVLMDVHEGGI
jgi:hypothetical protein